MKMIHTTIGANSASTGDGLWSEGSSKIYLINSIVANGGTDEIYDSGSGFFNTYVYNSILHNSTNSVTLSSTGNLTMYTGSFSSDPLFVDSDNGNLSLSGFSPAIGGGSETITISGNIITSPATDINGNPRSVPTGSNPDMGAYENLRPSQRPKGGYVADGLDSDIAWTNSSSTLSGNWSGFVDDGDLTYEYAIGSASNSTEVTGDNYSLSFDGNDDFVELMNIPSGLSSFSYVGWYKKIGANGSGQPIMSTPNGTVIFSGSGESLNAIAYQNRNGSSPTYEISSDNFGGVQNWNQFIYTVDNGSMALYVNGNLVDTQPYEYQFQTSFIGSYIGALMSSNGLDGSFYGFLDEISIFNYSLNYEDIQNYSGKALSGNESGLIAHYNFNQGSGNELLDITGNGYNGTINGANWSTDTDEPNFINFLQYIF